jgi:hypothetical protein
MKLGVFLKKNVILISRAKWILVWWSHEMVFKIHVLELEIWNYNDAFALDGKGLYFPSNILKSCFIFIFKKFLKTMDQREVINDINQLFKIQCWSWMEHACVSICVCLFGVCTHFITITQKDCSYNTKGCYSQFKSFFFHF